MEDRVILHCDCNSFFASVEETFHPELRKVPMAVAGDPKKRHGIILAKNEIAKQYKIQTAEPVWSAKKKCPSLVLVPPRHDVYSSFCEQINAIYQHYTPLVERFGIDESFLDLTGCLFAYGEDAIRCANVIRERVLQEVDVTISIGVSWNKIFAKLGSDYKKPNAVTEISRENWKDIVFPLPVSDLFSVGKKTAARLSSFGVKTIGDLARIQCEILVQHFGKLGEQLYTNANGLDDSPVAAIDDVEPVKSVGNGYTFERDLVSEEDIRAGTIYLADRVAGRLRKYGLKCRTVQVSIRDEHLSTITRQGTLPAATDLSSELFHFAFRLIRENWFVGKPIHTLTVTAENLVAACDENLGQISLFELQNAPQTDRRERIERTLDVIRARYGRYSIQAASLINNDLGIHSSNGLDDANEKK